MRAAKLPSVMYHGTSAKALSSILTSGLRPRGRGRGNWDQRSHSRAVYLTTAYGLHFAAAAARRGDAFLILEVDCRHLDCSLLAPDEDFLEQSTRGSEDFCGCGSDLKSRTAWLKKRALSSFGHHWPDSIKGLGTCAYHAPISPRLVTRAAVVPRAHPLALASDPTITITNYSIMGGYYRQLMRVVFGDPIDFDDLGPVMIDRAPYLEDISREGVVVMTLTITPSES